MTLHHGRSRILWVGGWSLYHGVQKLEAGDLEAAIASFDAVIETAARDAGFARVQAAVHAQRVLAHEKQGAAAQARSDYAAALRLDPQ